MSQIVIIGLGGAGYSAAIYCARYGLKPIIIGELDGGLITQSHQVENFPGYPNPVPGTEIMQNMKLQAEKLGTQVILDKVKRIYPINQDFTEGYNVNTNYSGILQTQAIILALGTEHLKLNIPGEKEYFGKGVSYCATCDGYFFKNKKTAVIGGGNTALIESLFLSDICSTVYLIHRRNEFRGEHARLEKIKNKPNIQIITPAILNKINGSNKVNQITILKSLENLPNHNQQEINLDVDGVFVAIGAKPKSISGLENMIKSDNEGYLEVNSHQATNLPGIFAAGDCTTASAKFKQLVIACAEGALAAEGVFHYLKKICK